MLKKEPRKYFIEKVTRDHGHELQCLETAGTEGRKGTETFPAKDIWKNKSNEEMEGMPRLWDLLRDRKEPGAGRGGQWKGTDI